jgi:hypothetical protein
MQKSSFNILKGRGAVALAVLCNRGNEDYNVLANSVGQSLFCYSENIPYVCSALHTQGRHDARHKDAGFFYARTLNNSGSVPPCDVLMDSLPLWCNATGKAEPFFYSSPNINFLKMHYTEKSKKGHSDGSMAIKAMHASGRKTLIKRLYNRNIHQLINDFVVEMDAKNRAYYFILENGHLDAFKHYCQTKPGSSG